MTLTGACPGTVFSQVGTGIPSSIPVLIGTGIGGIIYSFLKPRIAASPDIVQKEKGTPSFTKPTLADRAGFSNLTALALYEVFLVGMVTGVVHFFPRNNPSLVDPVLGGALIGVSQLTSLLLTSSTLGTSTAFEQVGDLFWWLLSPSKPRPSIRGTAFATGALAGAYLLTLVAAVPMPDENIPIGTARAVGGGAILILGSRIAGGCTSGHGISGMSMLSVASILTVGGMFAGGMGSAALFRTIGW
ncbi:hypothetical protein BJ875DRAFT_464545 [Amylocarpus encephaloides]|uniref:Sulphur transport domain-containing protein n=1 Tax=Amylocarpus encephaloides TaxID=45428 RepID=A0A9P7YH20_9HELO|nr:hypothetical protein BJ875DRAFT_464545 [Amylocarpus encephaloides]